MKAKSPEMLELLRSKWRAERGKASALRQKIEDKYGRPFYINAPWRKREMIDRATKREDKAADRIFAWLEKYSPRSWRTGVPAHWVCESLTYDDALTPGRLSVTPPCAYGSYPSDSVRFAQAVA